MLYTSRSSGETLGFLPTHFFIRVANPRTFVRLRGTDAANLGRELPYFLPVDAEHVQLGRFLGHGTGGASPA